MKKALQSVALACFCLFLTNLGLLAQSGRMEMNLTVKDQYGKPMPETEVEFVDLGTQKRLQAKTNESGQLTQVFDQGQYWQINIGKIKGYFLWQFEVVPEKSLRMERIVTYDVDRFERETRPVVDRSKLKLKSEPQKFPASPRADAEYGVIHLAMHRPNKQALGNYPVQLTNYALGKTFTGKTNVRGDAWFRVPLGNEYEVDIDGIESFAYADLPTRSGIRITRRITYEPSTVNESNRRDTIFQDLPKSQKGTSDRVMCHLKLTGGPEGVWKGEPVFLEIMGEKGTYFGKTDGEGKVGFLLPMGKRYMAHGRFQRNLDVVDLRRRRGVGYANKSIRYTPLAKYQFPEEYIPKPEDLVTSGFRTFMEKQYPRPEAREALRTLAEFMGLAKPGAKEAVLRLAFTTPEKGNIDNAPPLNLAFVVDRSGSMAGEERIDELKKSLAAFVKLLRPDDFVSLVSFAHEERIDLATGKMDVGKFLTVLNNIEADGGTDIFLGMVEGYKQVMKHYRKDRANRVILLSDGYGTHPPKELVEAQKPYSDRGIACSTVGVGEDYNFALLKLLASYGGGHVQHVADAKDLKTAFMEELASILFPVAQKVDVTIQYPKGLSFRHLYGFPVKEKGGQYIKLRMDNCYAGIDQLAFLRFRLDSPTPEKLKEPVRIKVSYKDLATGNMVTQENEAYLKWEAANGDADFAVDQEEKKLYSIAIMNQSLKVMADRFHGLDLAGAKTALEDGLTQLKWVHPSASDEDINDLRESLESYLDVIARQLTVKN